MSEAIKKLQDIGATKIHEETHISKHHAQAILHQAFEGLSKLQVNGFISILEREYEINLDELKHLSDTYFNDIEDKKDINTTIFVNSKKKESNTFIYLFIAILFLGAFTFFISSYSKSNKTLSVIEEKKIIQDVEKKIDLKKDLEKEKKVMILDLNISDDNKSETNLTVTKIENIEENLTNKIVDKIAIEKKVIVKTFEVFPKSKVWIGRFNLQTHKKREGIVRHKLTMNTKDNFLMILGHSDVQIKLDSKIFKFTNKGTLHLKFIDGKLSIINNKEFKQLSNGYTKW